MKNLFKKHEVIKIFKLIVIILFGMTLSDMTEKIDNKHIIISLNYGIGLLTGIVYWHESNIYIKESEVIKK